MYTKPVLVTKEISREEAGALLVEARVVRVSGSRPELDVYQNCGGMLYRVYTMQLPAHFDLDEDPDLLLGYARNHMPNEINF